MRIGVRFVVAACSLIAMDACVSRMPGRQPGSDMVGPGSESVVSRAVRESLSRCAQDPKGGTASPSEQERCRVAEADAARRKAPQDTVITPRKTP